MLIGMALAINMLLWLIPQARVAQQLQYLRAVIPDWLLGVGGFYGVLEHVERYLGSSAAPVTADCAILSAGLVFVVFVLVFPSGLSAKKKTLLFGLPLLLVAHLIRWCSLLWSGELLLWKTNYFYDYLGLVGFVLLVALVWFVGIERSFSDEA